MKMGGLNKDALIQINRLTSFSVTPGLDIIAKGGGWFCQAYLMSG